MNKKGLADWLIQRRKADDLTQDQLAARSGYTKAHISKVETQRLEEPSLDFLSAICRSLGVSIIDPLTAMGYVKPQPQPEPRVLRLIHYYQSLMPDDKKLAEELIKTMARQRGTNENSEKPAKRKPA